MVMRPENSTPKPMKISPTPRVPRFLMNVMRITPAIRAIGASEEGFSSSSRALPEESMSISRMIWAVTVVPMLAPITMLTACRRLRMPAAIRPTVSTMVALEDWIMAVTARPVSIPVKAFLVSPPKMRFRVSPLLSFRPSPISSIP